MTRARPPRLGAVVLAAGQSKRFRSALPKVLHPLAGRPLVAHVLATLAELHHGTLPLARVVLVVPPGREVERALEGAQHPFPVAFAVQRAPRGTGDAARVGVARLGEVDELLVLAGDMPLVRAGSLEELVRRRRAAGAAAAVLTAVVADPGDYGRVLREDGRLVGIVEARDATIAQRRIGEVNTSTYAFDPAQLRRVLPRLRADNAQGEYYLTDAVRLLLERGQAVVGVQGAAEEGLGVNTRREYAEVTRILRRRALHRLMEAGVTVLDPESTYVDVDVAVGPDTVLLPATFLEGRTRVGSGCEIGPHTRLVDATVGDGARITFSVVREATIGPQCEVGPFASLRPGTVLRRGAKAGTFVEMKAAEVGEGSKVPHLAYMGDAVIGRGVNVGAGTITCNFDGRAKHQTVIEDHAFIGTNTSLRAPVRIGRGAYTGAGSVVTHDVGPGEVVFGVPARPQGRRRSARAAKRSSRKGT